MNPGTGNSGVGGGKMSQIAGCDYAVGWMNGVLTAHEMGHAFDLAHAEMWTNGPSLPSGSPAPRARTRPTTLVTSVRRDRYTCGERCAVRGAR